MHSADLQSFADNLAAARAEARSSGQSHVTLSINYLDNLVFVLDRLIQDVRQMEQAMASAVALAQSDGPPRNNVVPFQPLQGRGHHGVEMTAHHPDGAA